MVCAGIECLPELVFNVNPGIQCVERITQSLLQLLNTARAGLFWSHGAVCSFPDSGNKDLV